MNVFLFTNFFACVILLLYKHMKGLWFYLWIRYYILLLASLLGPLPIQTIVKFFAISLIVFGLALFVGGTYNQFAINFESVDELDTSLANIEFSKDRKYSNYSYNSQ